MCLVHVENLTHSFGDQTIFRRLSFRLLAGEHVGLIGASGAGKSTLLRILCGEKGQSTKHPIKPGFRAFTLQAALELRPAVGASVAPADFFHDPFAADRTRFAHFRSIRHFRRF
jgi:ATPase subunit of ABC transporter with duplicated ATPase domains